MKTAKGKWHYFLSHGDSGVLFRVRDTGVDQCAGTAGEWNPAIVPYTLKKYRRSTYIEISAATARKRFPNAFPKRSRKPDKATVLAHQLGLAR